MKETAASKTHAHHAATPEVKNVLVLQGGGALGAYHIGAYQALHELGFEPDWVTGISIGALNAAVLATNKPEDRLRKMVEFWDDIARPDGAAASYSGAYRAMYNKSVVAKSMLQGLPNFWTPRVNVMMGMGGVEVQFANPTETSYYDTSPMLDTLRRHCNFAWHNQGHGARLSLGATRVDTGKLEFFDSLNCQIGPAHALASGSLPPGFPATEINGKYYWDGGCVTNTPLQAVLDDTHETADLRVFMVDLWGAHGRLPTTMDGVAWRQKEIQYASRMDQHGTLRKYQKLFGRLLHSPECAGIHGLLHGWAEEVLGRRLRNIDIHTITYRHTGEESSFSDAEFSAGSIKRRREMGYVDMLEKLDRVQAAEQAAQRHPADTRKVTS